MILIKHFYFVYTYYLLGDYVKKKLYIIISLTICILSICVNTKNVEAYSNNRIIIDPGHGGMDAGASVGDVNEDDLNLEIAFVLRDVFEQNGYYVDMTRYDEEDLCDGKFIKREDMNKRIEMINNGQYLLCVSIHQNKFSNSKFFGSQTFYSDVNKNNKLLAENVQQSLKTYLGNTSREAKKRDNVYLLNKTIIPSCIVECGFMSNNEELKLLMNKDYQYKLANSIYYGCLTFLRLI